MANERSLKRREFLRMSTATIAAGLAAGLTSRVQAADADTIEEAALKVGQLPRRKLGYSRREVSILIGAGDLDRAATEAGILCGMNYWHKANLWGHGGAPKAILNNREAHYCQVNVDRVGGNHETGRIDEESHVAFVKESLKRTGLGYYDDMQFHYGYHNVAEIKNNRGFVRAFERLKKEGLVKHLCIAQHGYAGNARVPGGESAAEILTALVEDGLYEHAQFIYSYGAEPAMDAFMEFAQKRGFGTIAMKTARGIGRMKQDQAFMDKLPAGTSPYNALVRWLTTSTRLDAVVIRVRNLHEFVETFSGAGRKLRAEDALAIEMMTARANQTTCRLCTECQAHCSQRVPIAEILRFERYAMDDGDLNTARALYAQLDRRGDACVGCGSCLAHCPQGLPIHHKLAAAHALLG